MFGNGVGTNGAGGPGILQTFGIVFLAVPKLPFVTGVFGEGLTATVRDALSCLHSLDGRINSIICDINGERYRSEEWGFVCLHLGTHFDNPTGYLSPAEYWGDMGAASGPLFAMLFLQANARGYSKGSRTLMWASSEGGQRGCVVLETST